MLPQLNILMYDKEAQHLKKQWEEIFPTEKFPCYTYDIDGHKQKIKEAIATKDKTEIEKIGSTTFISEYFSQLQNEK